MSGDSMKDYSQRYLGLGVQVRRERPERITQYNAAILMLLYKSAAAKRHGSLRCCHPMDNLYRSYLW